MKKTLILCFMVFMVVILAACGGGTEEKKDTAKDTGPTTTEPAKADAEKIYQTKCSSCHGQNLEGAVGPALDKIGATLTKDDILNTIKNGKGMMPKNIISGEDAEAVATWLSEKK